MGPLTTSLFLGNKDMANTEFYTYVHRKADTGEVFYVGKGQGGRVNKKNGRTKYWKHIVALHGFVGEITSHFDNEQEAFAEEVRLIASYRSMGVRLCNLTDGGDGRSGAKDSEETKRKKSIALTGFKRGPHSDELKKKLSEAKLGKKQSKELVEKRVSCLRGKKIPAEVVAARVEIRKANGSYKQSAESLRKMVETRRSNGSYTFNEAQKLKISEATKAGISAKRRVELSQAG